LAVLRLLELEAAGPYRLPGLWQCDVLVSQPKELRMRCLRAQGKDVEASFVTGLV